MKKIIICIISFLLTVNMSAQGVDYTKPDSMKVMALFHKAKALRDKSMATYMVFFGRELKNVPYVAKTLEKNSKERLIVNLRQLDCTTYVETVLALSRAMRQGKPTFHNYCENLRKIRYCNGNVAYTARQHYFTYWIKENTREGIVRNIVSPNPPYSATQTVTANYMTKHVEKYPMLKGRPQWVKQIEAMEKSITGTRQKYIPKQSVTNSDAMKKAVRNGDIIAIVTTKTGLEISHIGVAVWHRDGLHMLNASSLYHKVVEDSNLLRAYLYKQKSALGIRIARPL